ncbi:hypothetical protein ACJMK2_029412 [Sinanodonta woodiana]|uniref:sphingomyelin phosphodiesterase n=1 Tax=Sinanodonta woodiana TaxID=1069815 RepID=A0ABD3XA23_SINWO
MFSLSCAGVPVPVVCKKRRERMHAIADELSAGEYDIVFLQEIWLKADYQILKSKLCSRSYPYAHYFYSGYVGSGMCIFSKYTILDSIYYQYQLNGYPHKIYHGDWFGGKGVGLCKLKIHDLTVYLYITHIHAEYSHDNDEYLAHRVSQAFDMSQFVKYTSSAADVIILCGDLNLEPKDLGYNLIRVNTGLRDAWVEKQSTRGLEDGMTCDRPSNSFCDPKCLTHFPNGKRIDYILYNARENLTAEVKECSLVMGKIAGRSYNYSDHEGVMAHICIQDKKNHLPSSEPEESLDQLLQKSIVVLNKGLEKAKNDKYFFIILALICAFLFYVIGVVHIPYPFDFIITFFKIALTVSAGYGIINNIVLNKSEVNGLMSSKEDINNLLQNLPK